MIQVLSQPAHFHLANAPHQCTLLPTQSAAPGAILAEGFQSQALVKLLGCGIGAGAAASLGLKQVWRRLHGCRSGRATSCCSLMPPMAWPGS